MEGSVSLREGGAVLEGSYRRGAPHGYFRWGLVVAPYPVSGGLHCTTVLFVQHSLILHTATAI
jgi:hypothetical protein